MNKKIIFTIIILLLLVGGGVAIYYLYEIPKSGKDVLYSNVSIIAKYQNKPIHTKYIIESSNFNSDGFTFDKGYTFDRVPLYTYIKVYNENLVNQSYYVSMKEVNISDESPNSVNLLLEKPEEVFLKYNFDEVNKTINVNISSKNFKNPFICLHWRGSYIYVKANNLTEVEKPQNYLNFTRCYDLNGTIKQSKNIELNYKLIGLKEDGEIIFSVIDRDYFRGKLENCFENKDLFGKDKIENFI